MNAQLVADHAVGRVGKLREACRNLNVARHTDAERKIIKDALAGREDDIARELGLGTWRQHRHPMTNAQAGRFRRTGPRFWAAVRDMFGGEFVQLCREVLGEQDTRQAILWVTDLARSQRRDEVVRAIQLVQAIR